MIFTALEGYKLQYRSSHNWYIGNTKYSFSKCCAQIVEVMLELWRMPKKDPRCRNTMCPEKYTSRGRVNNQVENLPAPSKSRRLQSYCDQVHRDTPDAHKTDKIVPTPMPGVAAHTSCIFGSTKALKAALCTYLPTPAPTGDAITIRRQLHAHQVVNRNTYRDHHALR